MFWKRVFFFPFLTTILLSISSCNTKTPDEKYKLCISEIEDGNYTNALKYCEMACKEKLKEACFKQAHILDVHIQGGRAKAGEIFKSLCEDGVAEACYRAGNIYEEKNLNLAKKLYEKGCSLNDQHSCQKSQLLIINETPQSYEENVDGTYDFQYLVEEYFRAVIEKRIDDAIEFYVSYKKPKIRRDILMSIANATEYFTVDEVKVISINGNNANVLVRVRKKNIGKPGEEVWEGLWDLEKENGLWKIVNTPGKRIM